MKASLIITQLRSFYVLASYSKQVWDYLKQGIIFTVLFLARINNDVERAILLTRPNHSQKCSLMPRIFFLAIVAEHFFPCHMIFFLQEENIFRCIEKKILRLVKHCVVTIQEKKILGIRHNF